METLIIDREILPEPIFSCIKSKKIKIIEENGNIVLSPINEKLDVNDLFGKYPKLSSKDFKKQRAIEEGLEN